MSNERETPVRLERRRGVIMGAAGMLAVVFVAWTMWTLGELRRDVALMKDWARSEADPMVSAASRERAADELAAARVAEVLARSESASVKGCSTGAYPQGSLAGESAAPRGESVDALEWLQRAGQG